MHYGMLYGLILIVPESRLGRSGYMSIVSSGNYPGKSMVHMLPIIDLDPNDIYYIYSTLSFIIQQSQELRAANTYSNI